jgi:hypothetical protein
MGQGTRAITGARPTPTTPANRKRKENTDWAGSAKSSDTQPVPPVVTYDAVALNSYDDDDHFFPELARRIVFGILVIHPMIPTTASQAKFISTTMLFDYDMRFCHLCTGNLPKFCHPAAES